MLELEYQLITGLMQQPGFPQQPGLLQPGLLQAGLTQVGLMQAGLMQTGVVNVQHPGLMQQAGLAQPCMWSRGAFSFLALCKEVVCSLVIQVEHSRGQVCVE